MKISSAIVALCLAGQVSAFVVQTSKASQPSVIALQQASNGYSYLSGSENSTNTMDRTDFVAAKSTEAPPKNVDSSSSTSSTSNKQQEKSSPAATEQAEESSRSIWDNYKPIVCQGGSLRTFSFTTPYIERIQIVMKTEGRPLNANIDLWQGPDNTPQKMSVYIEDGNKRPFCAVVETPGGQNTIAIRNTGQVEFPLSAGVEAEVVDREGNCDSRLAVGRSSLPTDVKAKAIQGGAIRTYSFDPNVSSVQILLKTDGRPLNARVELLQGPNNSKQVIEMYTEDGLRRPFYAVIETPGSGNVVRVINTAPVEFPLSALVEPFLIDDEVKDLFVVSGGGGGWDSGSSRF